MSVMKKHFELLLVKGERSDDNLHYGRISFPERMNFLKSSERGAYSIQKFCLEDETFPVIVFWTTPLIWKQMFNVLKLKWKIPPQMPNIKWAPAHLITLIWDVILPWGH